MQRISCFLLWKSERKHYFWMVGWELCIVFSGVYFLRKGPSTESQLPSAEKVFSLSSCKLPYTSSSNILPQIYLAVNHLWIDLFQPTQSKALLYVVKDKENFANVGVCVNDAFLFVLMPSLDTAWEWPGSVAEAATSTTVLQDPFEEDFRSFHSYTECILKRFLSPLSSLLSSNTL